MKNNDFEKAKKEGNEKRVDFEENRDGLEGKYHVKKIYIFLFKENLNLFINLFIKRKSLKRI